MQLSYIKKFGSIFDNQKYHGFCDIELMKEEVEDKYNGLVLAFDPFDPRYEARKYSPQSKKEIDLDSIESMSAHEKRKNREKKEVF